MKFDFSISDENVQSEPRDLKKPKIHEETIDLDPTGPRESTKKLRFDPVNIWRCDGVHTITSRGDDFFFIDFWESRIFRKCRAQIPIRLEKLA